MEMCSGKLLRTLEGHTGMSKPLRSPGRALLARRAAIRQCACGVARYGDGRSSGVDHVIINRSPFIPKPLLAAAGSEPTREKERCRLIHSGMDLDVLLGKRPASRASKALHHTTAKIVLVGDSGWARPDWAAAGAW